MEPEIYDSIVEFIQSYSGLSKNCLKELQEKHSDLNYDTLYSIVCISDHRKMKNSYGKTQTSRNKFWELYQKAQQEKQPAGIIVKLAEKYNIAPCLLAKLILQMHYENVETEVGAVNLTGFMRNTNLIEDPDLAYEVFLCTMFDNSYSPLADNMRMSLGQQYEIRLFKEAENLGLAFRDEEYLRKYGYDKTPDFKLDVPVAIDGFVINWIESKALFADQETHREYMANQYLSYWNRFGPGLVIYWFGFVKSITEPHDKRFIIRDHLPTNVVKPSVNVDHDFSSTQKEF